MYKLNIYVWVCGSDSKESACNAGDPDLIPGLERFPGEGNGNPRQYSCLENSMDRGILQATVHGVAESDTTEQLKQCIWTVCVCVSNLSLSLSLSHTHTHTYTQQYLYVSSINSYKFNWILALQVSHSSIWTINTYKHKIRGHLLQYLWHLKRKQWDWFLGKWSSLLLCSVNSLSTGILSYPELSSSVCSLRYSI